MDKKLFEILVCPVCRAEVILKDEKIVCVECGLKYSIKDGIPVMLVDEAQK